MSEKKYCNLRTRYVNSLEDFNKMLEWCEKQSDIIEAPLPKLDFYCNTRVWSFIEDCQRYIKLTTRYIKDIVDDDGNTTYQFLTDDDPKYVCTWLFDKTGEDVYHISPNKVYNLMKKVYLPFDIIKEEKDLPNEEKKFPLILNGKHAYSASPILGFNKAYDRTEHYCYGYDLNSAYAAVLSDKIPDTYHMRLADFVCDGEIGFDMEERLPLVFPGEFADYVFPLIDSPYKEFVREWYEKKKSAPKGSKEKQIAKEVLVISVGLMQNHNPFLRAYVVNMCNKKIKDIIDAHPEECCMWNTDAVYSTAPLDLEIGENIGQFKLEYQGMLRQVNNNYQKVDEHKTTYRGVCKMLFKEDFNILTDPIPDYDGLKYMLDKVQYKKTKIFDYKVKERE